jgi:hypothetical protein
VERAKRPRYKIKLPDQIKNIEELMPYPLELSQWMTDVSTYLPVLSGCQARLLALFSYAVIMTQSCGMSHVSFFVARLLHQRENTVRQRLREFTYDAADKRGDQRRDIAVRGCFVPLLRWVQSLWCSEEHTLVLALDTTTLREVFTVLSISVLVGGCAIPVGWVIVRAAS